MKITIVIGAFLPCPPIKGGGVEKMWFELAKKFANQGHSVDIISKEMLELGEGKDEFGINHIRLPGFDAPRNIIYRLIMDLKYTFKVLSKINADSDIVISNTFWLPILASKQIRKKIYVDVARMPKGQLKFYKDVGCLRTNSTPVKIAVKREVNNVRISCIPNPLTFEIKNELDFYERSKTILYVGRIHEEKGIGLLIDAFSKLDTDWKLNIIGPSEISDGGSGSEYLSCLKKSAFNKNVEFIPPIYDKDRLIAEYCSSQIFVYPSLAEKGETFGLAPLEAMACGSVPIVSDLLCFKDFIENGVNGLIFDHRSPNAVNELTTLLDNLIKKEDVLRSLSLNCLRVLESHSLDVISDAFINDFYSIIDED